MSATLPRLLDRRQISAELGVKLSPVMRLRMCKVGISDNHIQVSSDYPDFASGGYKQSR